MKEDQQNPLRMQNGSLGLGKGKIQVEHGTVSLLSECWVPASPEVKTVLQCGAWVQSLAGELYPACFVVRPKRKERDHGLAFGVLLLFVK